MANVEVFVSKDYVLFGAGETDNCFFFHALSCSQEQSFIFLEELDAVSFAFAAKDGLKLLFFFKLEKSVGIICRLILISFEFNLFILFELIQLSNIFLLNCIMTNHNI